MGDLRVDHPVAPPDAAAERRGGHHQQWLGEAPHEHGQLLVGAAVLEELRDRMARPRRSSDGVGHGQNSIPLRALMPRS